MKADYQPPGTTKQPCSNPGFMRSSVMARTQISTPSARILKTREALVGYEKRK